MSIRLVLRGIRCSISKSKATTQKKVSIPLLTPRGIMNQTTNQIIFFGNHHHRHCHHVPPDFTADKPPHSPFEHEDETSEFDCISGISLYSPFSDYEAEEAEPFDVDCSYYEDYIITSAHFAINFHNQKQNAQLQFVRVLKADELHVAGSLLYITLEVNDAGKSDFYRTIIHYMPWLKQRDIIAWEHVEASPFPSPTK